ncbi:hypothetical protein SASPL_157084 [Salvia splendens]|uniref:Exostosin GT47 domain-containing protein n=1 Tax=Salvia splendens TaxID=180675 RepID=A0A8X8YUT3_SALSN|nr:hypothetical protein SASPL_157084 [Salvia splendens]
MPSRSSAFQSEDLYVRFAKELGGRVMIYLTDAGSLMDWLEEQIYWKRNNGWDHVFICQDPNALYKVIDRVKNGVLLVSDFGRLARNQASLVKDVILPYSHRINTFKKGCRAGETATSAILYGESLSKRDVIDYRKIAIFVDSTTATKPGHLAKLLRKVRPERILKFQKELLKVKRYFEYEDPNGTVKEIWRQVSQKLPLIKLMSNRDQRIVLRDLTEPDCSCIYSNLTGVRTTL